MHLYYSLVPLDVLHITNGFNIIAEGKVKFIHFLNGSEKHALGCMLIFAFLQWNIITLITGSDLRGKVGKKFIT